MSKIAISGASTGTATFTIESPATSTNRTLTLPDNTGTIVTTGTTTGISASAISTGTLAAARLPAGTVLQVVQGSYVNTTSTTSTSYVDTGLSASITPIATANKVLVIVQASIEQLTSGTSARFVIDRSGTKPQDPNFIQSLPVADGITLAFAYLDSPSSTSSLTYKIQFRNEGAGFTTIFGNISNVSYTYNTITLMEIAG